MTLCYEVSVLNDSTLTLVYLGGVSIKPTVFRRHENKVIKDFVKNAPQEDDRFESGSEVIDEEPGGGIFEPENKKPKGSDTPFGRGAVIHKK